MKQILCLNNLKAIFMFFFVLVFSDCICQTNTTPLKTQELKSYKKLVEEIHIPTFLTRVGDKMVLSNWKGDTLLYVYSLPDFKFLGGTGTKGKGPGEIQAFPMFCESEDESLYIWGYTHKTIRKCDVTKEGEFKVNKIINLPYYMNFNKMHIIKDSLFIYYLPVELKIVKTDLKSGRDLDNIVLKKDDHKEAFYYKNSGTVAANNSFLVYGYFYKKQIDIYKVADFKLHKQIIGKYKKQDPVIKDENNLTYYTSIVAGKKYFYALYEDIKTKRPIIEVYDYNGSFQKELKLDIKPEIFIVDEAKNTIYGYALNSNYEPCFMRFEY